MSTQNHVLDLADIDEFKKVLFQMNPQQIQKIIALVDSMKPEIEKRISLLSEIEVYVAQEGMTFQSLKLSNSNIHLK
jgi:hypothetical protein